MSTSLEHPSAENLSDADVLRNGIHILTATLLVIAIFASVRMPLGDAAANLVLLSAFAAVYFAGSIYMHLWLFTVKLLWLAALTALWVLDLTIAPAGIYLVFSLFFLYLRVLSMFWGVIMVIVAGVISVVVQIPDGLTFGGVMGPGVSAVVTIAIYYAFDTLHRINLEREELIAELVETRAQLAQTEREAGISAERQRIAHEIHDTLAQGLSSIQMLLHAAQRDIASEDPVRASQRMDLARSTAAENLKEARAMIAALQPAGLSETSLAGALTRMAEGYAATGELEMEVETDGEPRQLPMKVEAALLRIAQGAAGNVVKHAHASRARVTVTYEDDEVRLDVVDNGRGFDPEEVRDRPAGLGHIGLSALQRRAEELGGTISVESTPGCGTAVSVSVPLVD
ncbi:sensor histidine kinase [Corynebacterium confusum]|uniref:sensor histidine kinase n=1 Tax=Corynebacterium confusum TaxID=71254 RepID=UPI0025B4CC16|nr:sensor histidine kinase [Corynebacterium confusum]WJY90685.1 Sensor histidine kinase LiaS [Corynebacterium confusum]